VAFLFVFNFSFFLLPADTSIKVGFSQKPGRPKIAGPIAFELLGSANMTAAPEELDRRKWSSKLHTFHAFDPSMLVEAPSPLSSDHSFAEDALQCLRELGSLDLHWVKGWRRVRSDFGGD
jgi:hypothetical protein